MTVGDIIELAHTGTDVIYSGRGSVVTMAVEWVTDRLYWVEFDGSNSQVCIMDILLTVCKVVYFKTLVHTQPVIVFQSVAFK